MQYLHESIYQSVLDQLVGLYKQVKIGDPLEKGTLVGPVHTQASKENFEKGISTIKSQACSMSLGEACTHTLNPRAKKDSYVLHVVIYLFREGRSLQADRL